MEIKKKGKLVHYGFEVKIKLKNPKANVKKIQQIVYVGVATEQKG